MTGVLTVALIFLAIRILFDQLPKVLEIDWRSGLINVPSNDTGVKAFLEYINQFEIAPNAKYELGLALLFAFGSLFATYPFRYWVIAKRFPFDFIRMIAYYFGGQWS